MSRSIDADALTERFRASRKLWLSADEVLDEISDAPELIKEREPRVLALNEYADWCLGKENRDEKQNTWKPKTPLLIEKRRENVMYWLNAPEKVVHIDKEYGKTFIVWTGYPTKEQREKVKWDETY